MNRLQTEKLLDLSHTIAKNYLQNIRYPWRALPGLKEYVILLGSTLGENFDEISPGVWVHKSATIAPTACLTAPCIIDENTSVRHCAFIRGSVIIGKNCVVGNSVEIKNAILFDRVQVPHFNYIGDSILGYKSHFGAGAVTSNVKADRTLICIKRLEQAVESGLKKFGAIVGDNVEIGCNTVLNPGTVVGRNSIVYPCVSLRGFVPEKTIVKNNKDYCKRI